MRRGRAWKKRARCTATASLPLWARIPRFYIWNNELERAKDAICERPLNLYVCRRGALWLAYHRTQTQSATQWEFLFNPSTDIDSYYSYDTRTRQKCFIRTGYSFQPSIRLNSNIYIYIYIYIYISGGPLSALTCCVNVRLLSAIKKISPLIYSQSWVGSWVYTTQAMMTFTLIF